MIKQPTRGNSGWLFSFERRSITRFWQNNFGQQNEDFVDLRGGDACKPAHKIEIFALPTIHIFFPNLTHMYVISTLFSVM